MKGTGVAHFVRNDINASTVDRVGFCTPDIFHRNKQHRLPTISCWAPSGDIDTFLNNMHFIVNNLPKKDVHILDDFNIAPVHMNVLIVEVCTCKIMKFSQSDERWS